MRPDVRASALWGLTSGLLFVVLAFGYRLATGTVITIPVTLGGTVFVGIVTTALSYGVRRRIA